jgi:hypothetical protein
MKFKDYLRDGLMKRGPRMDRGKTTKDHGHDHDYAVDHITGDGATSKDAGHNHKIRKFKVQPAKDGHIHKLK